MRIVAPRTVEQFLDLAGREHVRHALPQLLAAEQFGQVVAEHAFELQIPAEELQRHDVPGNRRRGQFCAVQPGGIVGQVANAQLHDPPAPQPFEESPHIPAIGGHRVVGQMALAAQVLQESFQPTPAGRSACDGHRLENSAWRHDGTAVKRGADSNGPGAAIPSRATPPARANGGRPRRAAKDPLLISFGTPPAST